MAFDRHARFDVLGDIPVGVAGPIGIVNEDWYADLANFEPVLFYELSVDGAGRTTAIE